MTEHHARTFSRISVKARATGVNIGENAGMVDHFRVA
jgi:hypothetical protein